MTTSKTLSESENVVLHTMSREVHAPAPSASTRRKKVIAISSGGGHWVQMLRLRPAFEDCDLTFATVNEGYRHNVGNAKFRVIPDCTRWSKWKMFKSAVGVFWMLLCERPDVVISTGAAPGYFGVRFGKLLGARTIWVDSIANVEIMSMSGQKVRKYADLWLTQWPHLASETGPQFAGNVL